MPFLLPSLLLKALVGTLIDFAAVLVILNYKARIWNISIWCK